MPSPRASVPGCSRSQAKDRSGSSTSGSTAPSSAGVVTRASAVTARTARRVVLGLGAEQPRQLRVDLAGGGGRPAPCWNRHPRPGGQRQRQRRAVGPRDELRAAPGLAHATAGEQRIGVVGAERPQRHVEHDVVPAGAEPAGRRRMARGDDDERVRGQARQHVAAQMPVERGQALPGVEQHSGRRAVMAGARARSTSSASGASSRASTATRVDSPARRASSCSSALLPMPAGPCSRTTLTGGWWSSRPSRRASSADRPTKPAAPRGLVTVGSGA